MFIDESKNTVIEKKGWTEEDQIAELMNASLFIPRYLDPSIGRFISEDPIRQNRGDPNLLTYVGNNPINRIDPSGHDDSVQGAEGSVKHAAIQEQFEKLDPNSKTEAKVIRTTTEHGRVDVQAGGKNIEIGPANRANVNAKIAQVDSVIKESERGDIIFYKQAVAVPKAGEEFEWVQLTLAQAKELQAELKDDKVGMYDRDEAWNRAKAIAGGNVQKTTVSETAASRGSKERMQKIMERKEIEKTEKLKSAEGKTPSTPEANEPHDKVHEGKTPSNTVTEETGAASKSERSAVKGAPQVKSPGLSAASEKELETLETEARGLNKEEEVADVERIKALLSKQAAGIEKLTEEEANALKISDGALEKLGNSRAAKILGVVGFTGLVIGLGQDAAQAKDFLDDFANKDANSARHAFFMQANDATKRIQNGEIASDQFLNPANPLYGNLHQEVTDQLASAYKLAPEAAYAHATILLLGQHDPNLPEVPGLFDKLREGLNHGNGIILNRRAEREAQIATERAEALKHVHHVAVVSSRPHIGKDLVNGAKSVLDKLTSDAHRATQSASSVAAKGKDIVSQAIGSITHQLEAQRQADAKKAADLKTAQNSGFISKDPKTGDPIFNPTKMKQDASGPMPTYHPNGRAGDWAVQGEHWVYKYARVQSDRKPTGDTRAPNANRQDEVRQKDHSP